VCLRLDLKVQGVVQGNSPKRWLITVKFSSLTKMPRDCTALPLARFLHNEQSHYTMGSPIGEVKDFRPFRIAGYTKLQRTSMVTDIKRLKREKKAVKKTAKAKAAAPARVGLAPADRFDLRPKKMSVPKGITRSMTKDGADWFVQALDPCHDFARSIEGYPDMDSSNTVTAKVSYSATISAPAAVTWDCHVFTLPMFNTGEVRNGTYGLHGGSIGEGSAIGQASETRLGFLNVMSGLTGQALFPNSAVWNPTNYATTYLPALADIQDALSGFSRVIAAGYEVVNITPELTKGGLITTYKQPQHNGETEMKAQSTVAGNLYDGEVVYKVMRACPATVSEALKMPGCAQWQAKEGCYMVCPFNSFDNPLSPQTNKPYVISDLAPSNGAWSIVQHGVGAAATVAPYYTGAQYVPMDTVGVFLTGLSPETVLQVRLVVEYEKAPAHQDENVRYATVSPCYDVEALQAYAAIVRNMPIGTPLKNNWGGAWFQMILDQLKKIAGPIAGAFGLGSVVDRIHQGGSQIVSGVSQLVPLLP